MADPPPRTTAPGPALEPVLTASAISQQATRGAATYVTRVGITQALQVVSALVLARSLTPGEFGVFALALTLVGAARFFGDLGVVYYLAVERAIDDRELRTGMAVGLMVALTAVVLLCAIWPLVPLVSSGPRGSELVGPLLALTLLINVPRLPATVILERRLAFGRLGTVAIVETILLFATQVALLLAGAGVWALVVAHLLGAIVGTVGTLVASGRVLTPSFRGPIMRLVRSGLPFQTTLITTAIANSIIPIGVASILGARGVGLYVWAGVLTTPIISAVAAMHSVAAPGLARIFRDDTARFNEAATVLVAAIASISTVAAGCLVGIAPDIVRIMFGARWIDASVAAQIAIAGAIPLSVLFALAAVTDSQNQPRKRLRATIIGGGAAVATSLPLAAVWGVEGAALGAYIIGPTVSCLALARNTGLHVDVSILRPALLFVSLACASVAAGRWCETPVQLAGAAGVLGVAALILIRTLEPALVAKLWRQLRRPGTAPVAEHE